VGGRE